MKQLMLDLETMGKSTDAAIVSIGAVKFDLENRSLGNTFYEVVKLQSCLDIGLQMDASTVLWWLNQDKAAIKEITREGVIPIQEALNKLSVFYEENDKGWVWGNGIGFDNVIIETAYEAGMHAPWFYTLNRDVRTIVDLAKRLGIKPIQKL